LRRILITIVIFSALVVGLALTRPGRNMLASLGLVAACSTDDGCN
jgi:hypothetical protein